MIIHNYISMSIKVCSGYTFIKLPLIIYTNVSNIPLSLSLDK